MREPVNKRGPWSAEEKRYMEENAGRLTPKQMGEHLQRDPEAIERYVREGMYGSNFKSAKAAEAALMRSPTWDELKAQFTKEELDMFLYHWGRIVAQFRDDVYPTEEMQIIDTIKLDIMMNRILRAQHETTKNIMALELQLATESDLQRIDNINRQVGILRGSVEVGDRTYQDLLSKKETILKSMKATREARTKHLENSNKNFSTWMRQLLEDKELRRKVGLDMEKMRIATQLELERLSQYHQYADKTLDKPILNSETVDD